MEQESHGVTLGSDFGLALPNAANIMVTALARSCRAKEVVLGLARALSVLIESEPGSSILFEHDLFGKPVPTFPDHALSR